MNKAELIKKVEEATGFSSTTAKAATEMVLGEIAEALAAGENVQIAGFGVFSVKYRAARTGKNPQTGEIVEIPAKKTVSFKPAKALKDMMN